MFSTVMNIISNDNLIMKCKPRCSHVLLCKQRSAAIVDRITKMGSMHILVRFILI